MRSSKEVEVTPDLGGVWLVLIRRDDRYPLRVEPWQCQGVEVESRFASARKTQNDHHAVFPKDLHADAVGRPGIGGQNYQLDAIAIRELVND